jgi:transaldolase
MTPLQSIVASGTKLWLDSVDPDLIKTNRSQGATGATSNPIIISDLLNTGRFDAEILELAKAGHSDEEIAWAMTDKLVTMAQDVFLPVWEETKGDDGYVSFELDPLLEDPACTLTASQRADKYVELGKKWAAGHKNRMIKVPATEGGLLSLERLVAAGIALNVTLIFSERQYLAARDACFQGAQSRADKDKVKTVYSIFVSRVDVYTEKAVPDLSAGAQGMVGIVNAKQIWKLNRDFWADKGFPLKQEMIFASTGTKKKEDAPWKYVEAFAGSDIETNPPATNKAVQESGRTFTSHIHELPSAEVLAEIAGKVDVAKMEATLMSEGTAKFAEPFNALLKTIAKKRG